METQQYLLWIHLIGVAVWVGGQIVLATLVPALRNATDDRETNRSITSAAAQRFQIVSWAALGVVLFTGIAQLLTIEATSDDYNRVLFEKFGLVLISVGFALAHSQWMGPRIRQLPADDPALPKMQRNNGILAAVGLLAALLAVLWGIRLSVT